MLHTILEFVIFLITYFFLSCVVRYQEIAGSFVFFVFQVPILATGWIGSIYRFVLVQFLPINILSKPLGWVISGCAIVGAVEGVSTLTNSFVGPWNYILGVYFGGKVFLEAVEKMFTFKQWDSGEVMKAITHTSIGELFAEISEGQKRQEFVMNLARTSVLDQTMIVFTTLFGGLATILYGLSNMGWWPVGHVVRLLPHEALVYIGQVAFGSTDGTLLGPFSAAVLKSTLFFILLIFTVGYVGMATSHVDSIHAKGMTKSLEEFEREQDASEEDAVRVRAYEDWVRAGSPENPGDRFWLQAQKEIESSKVKPTMGSPITFASEMMHAFSEEST